MYSRSKKILSAILSLLLISIVTLVGVYAIAAKVPSNSKWAYISSSQSSAYSSSVYGTHKIFGGTNKGSSNHYLTICARYFDGSSNAWKFDKKIAVKINQSLNPTVTTIKSGDLAWQVYLKPYGAYSSGCNGNGYIYYS